MCSCVWDKVTWNGKVHVNEGVHQGKVASGPIGWVFHALMCTFFHLI